MYIKNNYKNDSIRRSRLKEAKKLGDHSKYEWIEMLEFFEYTCVKCLGSSGLDNVEKDHIIPLYMGGSNALDNIQPLCAKCNSSKGCEMKDYRPNGAYYLHKTILSKYTQQGDING